MNKIIQEQLKKCVVADLSNYNDATCTFLIPKYQQMKLDVDEVYLVKLDDNILRDKESLLTINWNRGTMPLHKYLKIVVSKTMGKMIYVDSIGYDIDNEKDIDDAWDGWLPINQIEVIKKL